LFWMCPEIWSSTINWCGQRDYVPLRVNQRKYQIKEI